MRVRLTKKFAQVIDDVDLRRFSVGQIIRVSPRDARVLVAEGWAIPYEVRGRSLAVRSAVADRSHPTRKKPR